ncbi:hypothetical protein CKO51_13065 [Rhodopirellula sp. SM50]|nr:ECF-type sigma factor [Rhodopirellula sp. SM50]PAY19058.1 hypothetical protein CKO51_13065 [Rhodopirellula sp. SM50]
MVTPANKEAESIAESLGSVTVMYQRAVEGDSQAPAELWDAYSKRLFGLARAVLRQRGITPAQASEDSIVNAAFAKFFDALQRGKYNEVADRHELWCLLATITRNNALNQAGRAGRQAQRVSDAESAVFKQADGGPTAEEVAALSDTLSDLEQKIQDRSTNADQAERIIQVMTMTLSGHTQREIAEAIGQSEVTVRRNLSMIRDLIDPD